jgi:hypothetical protein
MVFERNPVTIFKISLLALFALTAVIIRAETGTHPEIRRAIRESFQYSPVAQTSTEEPPAPILAPEVKIDSDIIVLPKYEVRSRPLPRGLTEAIAKSRSFEPQNHSKFGTGIHEKDFGKVRFSAVTVLYIPVLVGLSW